VYWWEVLECIRRLALTGFLVFILPGTAGQSAVACVFTVITLIVFSTAAPFADTVDFDNYWLGCMILFLSTILAFLLKGNYTATDRTNQEVLPALLVTLNLLLIVSVVAAVASATRRALPTISSNKASCSAPVGPKLLLQLQQHDQEQGPPN
jgi:NADH:ubiquinone oxidoreductase subunit 6 (subunit J)